MFYKNISYSEKTFYGVKFKPGEVAEVPGYINDKQMIVVPEKPSNKKQTTASDIAPAVTSKKDDSKKDDKKDEKKSSNQNSESVSEE